MAGEKIAKRFKDTTNGLNQTSDLIFGVVTGISPLKIKVDNRFEVGESHLILSRMVKELSISISVAVSVNVHVDGKNGVGDGSGSGNALVWRGLQQGDKVSLLKVQKGQTYYVLERV